ncbi:MAG: ABC transporter substrate-binding protein [Bdellovibrionales bacterium]|nr:ABC transporter substrate-binding protein [Bdellovibrionales bacterium]
MKFVLSLLLLLLYSTLTLAETVKIGLIIPLTGNQSVFGLDAKRALKLIAPNGTLEKENYTYSFILEDGQCGVGRSAITAAQKLLNIDKVKFLVLGCSGEVLQVAPLAQKSHVITIGYASSHPDIKNLGDYIFRTYVDITKAIHLIGALISEEQPGNVAVLTEESAFTLGIKKELLSFLGDRVGYSEDFHVDEVQFQTLLIKTQKTNPKAYYLNTASPRTYQNLYRQLRQLGITTPVYAYHSPSDPEVLSGLGTLQDGVKFVATPEVTSGSPSFEAFLDQYKTLYPEGPAIDFLLRSSYDAIMTLIQSIEAVGPDSEKVKNYLLAYQGEGAVGHISFDSNGDVENINFVLRQIKDGAPRPLMNNHS